MDNSIFNRFRLTAAEQNLNVYGVSVYNNKTGQTAEHRFRSDDRVCMFSCSKTFTSIGVGICRDRGLLQLSDKVLDFFPEFKSTAATGTERITVEHLLNMASGKILYWFDEADKQISSQDFAKLFLEHPVTKEPGSYFYYSNACTYMLSRIIHKVTGQNMRDFLVPCLFDPLGIANPQWHTCPGGYTLGATELFLTTNQLLQLGILLINKGEYKGKRIVSSEYVELLHSRLVDSTPFDYTNDPENMAGYGYQIWNCTREHTYRADGMYAQFCVIAKDIDAVVAVTSHEEKAPNDIIRAVFNDILPLI